MKIRIKLAITVSKLAILVCRLLKWGGTTLPGKIAFKIYPGILKNISADFKIIMVTGTNGKTTTSRIIGRILTESGIGYISNKSGANLLSGITSTFLDAVGINGKCDKKTALIEADEAAFNLVSDHLSPDILVVTNFFRDQLDRYGELYTTLKKVRNGIEKSDKTKLVLNADDSLCASLGKNLEDKTLYYGIGADSCIANEETGNSDAMFCIYCKSRYEYIYRTYGHLGGFNCPDCGYRRPDAGIACTKIRNMTSTGSEIDFVISNCNSINNRNFINSYGSINNCSSGADESGSSIVYGAKINLPGLYNVYNALAATACGILLGLPAEKTINALSTFECGFGRMETIKTGSKYIKIILVKNPTGFNQVMDYLLLEDKTTQAAFLINDRIADGTDISWLWDVDFEKLLYIGDKLDNLYTSGIRAEDMAVRLKYAGISSGKINIIKNYSSLIDTGLNRTADEHSFYILPTYTAMLDIRKILKQRFGLKEFWQ